MSQPVDPPVPQAPPTARAPAAPALRVPPPAGDGDRFAAALSGAERRGAAADAGARGGAREREARHDGRGERRDPTRARDADETYDEPRGGEGGVEPFTARTDLSAFGSPATGAGALDASGASAGHAGGPLEGPLSAAEVGTLVERLDALSASVSRSATFRVVDGLHGIESLNLVHSEAGWRVQLGAERGARAGARRYLAELEEGLVARGLNVDAVGWIDADERERSS